MKADWTPDDSLFRTGLTGELKGVELIKGALKEVGVHFGKGIVTSQDPGMQAAFKALERDVDLDGVQQWLLPIAFTPPEGVPVLWLISRLEANSSVPEHSHINAHFRMVIEGSCTINGVELGVSDWVSVPAGVSYGMQTGPQACIWTYPHPMPPMTGLTG